MGKMDIVVHYAMYYNSATAFLEPLGLVIASTPSIYTLMNIIFE